MGAGAGYTIETKDVKITGDIQIYGFDKVREDSNTMFKYDVIEVDCNVPITGSVRAESYMYNCDWIKNVPMTVTTVTINFMQYEGAKEVTEADILEILRNTTNYVGEGVYGGGYIHSTFDGEFDIRPSSDYADDIDAAVITINHANIVNFIDLAVTGDNREYEVRLNGEAIESFEDEDEAIEALKSMIRDEISENGFDSVDLSDCTVEENYWVEDVDGNFDIDDRGYYNIRYCADDDYDEFEEFAETIDELHNEGEPGIDEDFDI